MRTIGAFILGLATGVGAVEAAPVSIDYGNIVAQTLEDFESYEVGTGGQPLQMRPAAANGEVGAPGFGLGTGRFNGFNVSTDFAHVALVSDEPPCAPANQCLAASVSPLYSPIAGTPQPPVVTTFTDFQPGTRSFGAVLPGTFTSLVVQVVGATFGFSLEMTPGEGLTGPLAFGFDDPEGLRYVTFEGPAHFDDVVTSTVAPVPLPPTLGLLLVGLAALALRRRRSR